MRISKPQTSLQIKPITFKMLYLAVLLMVGCADKPIDPDNGKEVERIEIQATASEVKEMLTLQLNASVFLKNGESATDVTVSWSSSSNAIATVSSAGLVTGVAEGMVTITASVNEISGTYAIVVKKNSVVSISFIDLPEELTVSKYADVKASVEFETGHTLVNPAGLTFSVDDNAAASITDGKILGIKHKTVKVRATFRNQQVDKDIFINAVEINQVPSFLETPASNSVYEIPVVIIRYLPTADGINLDVSKCPDYWALGEISLDEL